MKLEDKIDEIIEREGLQSETAVKEFALWLLKQGQRKGNSRLPNNWESELKRIMGNCGDDDED